MSSNKRKHPTANLLSRFNIAPSQDNSIYRFRLSQQGSGTKIASNGATVVNAVLTMDPSSTGDWASYASIYDEFRVIAVSYNFTPTQQGSVTSIVQPIVVCFDNDDSSALSSYNQATEYPTHHVISSVFQATAEKPSIFLTWSRPTSGAPIPWLDVGAPSTSLGSIKFYGDSLSAGTQYFSGIIYYYVEFRGRR
jgi:hypothetical protein